MIHNIKEALKNYFEDESLINPAGTPGSETGYPCLLYTSPSPRDRQKSRMPSSA